MSDKVTIAIIVAIAVISTGVGISATLLAILAPGSSASTIIALVGFVAPTVTAFLAMVKGQQNSTKIDQVHHQFNSRVDELVDSAKVIARAEGVAEGKALMQQGVKEVAEQAAIKAVEKVIEKEHGTAQG